jgi:NAD(P)-dependent dehydrogenase (short-subunit alcohol dehydrogenase family)
MGKLDGKIAVITGGSSGMALAGAKLFVDEEAHVFTAGRRQEALIDPTRKERQARGDCDSSFVNCVELVVDGGTTAV